MSKTNRTAGWKFPHVTARLTTLAVVEQAEVEESEVEIKVECAGCGTPANAWGPNQRTARKRLAEVVAGWGVVFDRDVNDGEYPYCPACLKSIFPKLQARLRAEVLGKPLPPHNPPIPPGSEVIEDARAKEALLKEHRARQTRRDAANKRA